MARFNWQEVRAEYVGNQELSYVDVSKKHGMSVTAIKKYQKTNNEDWQLLRRLTSQEVAQKLPKKLGDNIAEVNARHIQLARMLQYKALEAMSIGNVHPKDWGQALIMIKEGVKMEREAYNMSCQNSPSV